MSDSLILSRVLACGDSSEDGLDEEEESLQHHERARRQTPGGIFTYDVRRERERLIERCKFDNRILANKKGVIYSILWTSYVNSPCLVVRPSKAPPPWSA